MPIWVDFGLARTAFGKACVTLNAPIALYESITSISFLFYSSVYDRFPKDSCYLAGNFFYRLVAAVDPDTAGVENHPSTPQQTLLGVSVTFTILTILTLESVQIFSRHSGPETAKV